MALLDFIDDKKHSEIADFWAIRKHEIPNMPGAYILLANGDTWFPYPAGSSPIYYIGQSTNLKSRLREHLKYSYQAKYDRQLDLYWPRYEFTAAYGGRYCYIRTWQGLTPKALEEIIIARFSRKYRSFPIANGSGSWNRITQIMNEV